MIPTVFESGEQSILSSDIHPTSSGFPRIERFAHRIEQYSRHIGRISPHIGRILPSAIFQSIGQQLRLP